MEDINKFLKDIHVGELIKVRIQELDISSDRICAFIPCTPSELREMMTKKSLDCDLLLKLSKILQYDFFRLYSQHLILYAPSPNPSNVERIKDEKLPV